MSVGPTRTSLQLYRDLLRLINHVAPGATPKSAALRSTVRSSFLSNAAATGSGLEAAKAGAVRALANYMLVEGVGQDDGLKRRSEEFFEREKPE